ncbi:MAG: AAA family ATPase [Lachnospiraceae bacterium]|nr:AAA family ATPase [Lachnospiraceae bacterium]MDE7203219.1 AAA family ATPase [Lachnospiraceae bacterium]
MLWLNHTRASSPRHFGKSFSAKMLCAYYDKTCDSSALFNDLEISQKEELYRSYRQHINKYDVIYLDMTYLKLFSGDFQNIVSYISEKITEELVSSYPTLSVSNELPTTIIHAVELTGNKFIMIIDEWDSPIRETSVIQKEYLEFLRTLFKGSGTTDKIFAAVYITGILSIKKDGTESLAYCPPLILIYSLINRISSISFSLPSCCFIITIPSKETTGIPSITSSSPSRQSSNISISGLYCILRLPSSKISVLYPIYCSWSANLRLQPKSISLVYNFTPCSTIAAPAAIQ